MCSAAYQSTTYALIRCYVAVNGWATAEATRRSSPDCSILLTTTFSSASSLTHRGSTGIRRASPPSLALKIQTPHDSTAETCADQSGGSRYSVMNIDEQSGLRFAVVDNRTFCSLVCSLYRTWSEKRSQPGARFSKNIMTIL